MSRRRRSSSRSSEEERRGREGNHRRGASNANAYGDRGHSLLIRNLPLDTEPYDLREAFRRFGLISDVHLPRDRRTGELRGFAYVEFVQAQAASEAQSYMNRQMFRGNYITVAHANTSRYSRAEMRSSARNRYGSYRSYHGLRSRSSSSRFQDRNSRYGSYRSYHGSRSRSRSRSYSRSRSPRYRDGHSRSYSPAPRRRENSFSP
ncbi:hypothetical protein LUZ62_058588 [Rhynchospora pubera]|uniref:RRM domain-containing protein n=1 Tax=Rhynchospora pubera TaxID=906938 RepID=A0AAV8E5M7_9POAL|nr:hypothetical protein LUZ62_058588 [Rhynchospora pubera]